MSDNDKFQKSIEYNFEYLGIVLGILKNTAEMDDAVLARSSIKKKSPESGYVSLSAANSVFDAKGAFNPTAADEAGLKLHDPGRASPEAIKNVYHLKVKLTAKEAIVLDGAFSMAAHIFKTQHKAEMLEVAAISKDNPERAMEIQAALNAPREKVPAMLSWYGSLLKDQSDPSLALNDNFWKAAYELMIRFDSQLPEAVKIQFDFYRDLENDPRHQLAKFDFYIARLNDLMPKDFKFDMNEKEPGKDMKPDRKRENYQSLVKLLSGAREKIASGEATFIGELRSTILPGLKRAGLQAIESHSPGIFGSRVVPVAEAVVSFIKFCQPLGDLKDKPAAGNESSAPKQP